jgi:hypothetical protein
MKVLLLQGVRTLNRKQQQSDLLIVGDNADIKCEPELCAARGQSASQKLAVPNLRAADRLTKSRTELYFAGTSSYIRRAESLSHYPLTNSPYYRLRRLHF